ncbi:hypothetical protein F909_02396 [Acinetobacter sp. ANC 3929]|nr:hypothetical protein F909_02396 [Acinetobacter sp. ANC 3929]
MIKDRFIFSIHESRIDVIELSLPLPMIQVNFLTYNQINHEYIIEKQCVMRKYFIDSM